jgi:hypothetical protein
MMENMIPIFKTLETQSQYMAAYETSLGLWPVPHTSTFVPTGYVDQRVLNFLALS